MSRICVIPAKARSTRLPGKNALALGGVPLVVRAVQVARAAGLFEIVVVSTDDDELARLSTAAGAEVPFRREASLTRDNVEVDAVVRNVLEWYEQHGGRRFTWLCTLQPTSPLRTVQDLAASWAVLEADPQADGIVSVSRYHHHPWWAVRVTDGVIRPEHPDRATCSRMDMPELFHPDGCIYWQRCRDVAAGRATYDGRMLAYRTPATSAVDVDYPEDLLLAEFLLARRQQSAE